MKRCLDHRGCGTLWLDPAPHPDALFEAYQTYYTHTAEPEAYEQILDVPGHQVWAAWLLGYEMPQGWRARASALRMLLRPKEIERALFFRLYLDCVPDGRLLDVGCGAGNQLLLMQRLGWRVSGTDADEKAVGTARQRGLDVRLGTVITSDWNAGEFDAITLIHVAEHLDDPIRHIRRCAELLKPGGRLVIVTPNVEAMGHKIFKRDWRGLEPPRHLQLYTHKSLRSAVEACGLAVETLRTSARDAAYMLWFSEQAARLRDTGQDQVNSAPENIIVQKWVSKERAERLAAWIGLNIGEEVVCVARRSN